MTKDELLKKVARLESINDQLITELTEIDNLMRLVGFSDGLKTVKETALELYESEREEDSESNEENAA